MLELITLPLKGQLENEAAYAVSSSHLRCVAYLPSFSSIICYRCSVSLTGQNIPVTAITESVRDAEFVSQEWDQVGAQNLSRFEQGKLHRLGAGLIQIKERQEDRPPAASFVCARSRI